MNTNQQNATAGPSTQTSPIVFSPPWPINPPPPSQLRGDSDLITRLGLLPAYDKHVRPNIAIANSAHNGASPSAPPSPTMGANKGKGREQTIPMDVEAPANAPTPGGVDGADEDGKGEKKRKNTYRHLIKGIPGKHSLKKDEYLFSTISIPPKSRIPIQPFDSRTQRDAFSVTLEGLKGWNINALLAGTPQAKEEKKKRKELRKLAKATVPSTPGAGVGASPAPSGFAVPSTPVPGTPSIRPPGTPRVSGIVYNVPPRGGTPRSSAPPTPISTAPPAWPTPTTATSTVSTPAMPHPLPSRPMTANVDLSRGKKREWEEPALPTNGYTPPAHGLQHNGASLAGGGGPRPRPVKKQKVELYA